LIPHFYLPLLNHSSRISKFGTEIGFTRKYGGNNSSDLSFSDKSSLKGSDGIVKPTATDEKKDRGFGSVFGQKKFNEEVFKPTFHYDDLVLPDIGGTLGENNQYETLTVPSSPTSSTVADPELGASYREANGAAGSPSFISEEPRRHSHDMV
jgi:pheromone a factor receptor